MAKFNSKRSASKATFLLHRGDDDRETITVTGRVKWALETLIRAGGKGCTPLENPALRWSHYVHMLRRMGVIIDTIHESHGGAFPGTHARYVLRSRVVPVGTGEGV